MLATGKILDRKERQIRNNLLDLFDLTRLAVEQSINYLQSGEPEQADTVRSAELQISEMRRLLEQDCLIAIASQQRITPDLGNIIASMRIAGELERIGDYALNILNISRHISLDHLELLGSDSTRAITAAYLSKLDAVEQAFETRNGVSADRAMSSSQTLTKALADHMAVTVARMKANDDAAPSAAGMLWIGQSLERCGDRLDNITDRIVCMIENEGGA